MATTNILANLFTTLFNTEDRRKKSCIVVPTSKLALEVLKTLKNEGYIEEFEHIDDKLRRKIYRSNFQQKLPSVEQLHQDLK